MSPYKYVLIQKAVAEWAEQFIFDKEHQKL